MNEENLLTYAYRVVRYTPNLVRDEWVNIGVLLYEPGGKRLEARLIESDAEFARLRRLHPTADVNVVRGLQAEMTAQFQINGGAAAYLEKLDESLSNVVQLSPQRGVLTSDFDAEMDRLYHDYVEPPRYPGRGEAADSRSTIRARAREVFRRAGILAQMEHGVRVDEFTFAGDPMRLDYGYRRNGTRGFVHALPLGREPAQAKALAFTCEQIRLKVHESEFAAMTEVAPQESNERHRFISGLLDTKGIRIVPLTQLEPWARELGASIRR
jgi:hypothetical protein